MEIKQLATIGQPQVTEGGQAVVLPLKLSDDTVLPLKISTGQIGELVHFLLQLSTAVGAILGIEEFTDTNLSANAVPLQPKGVGAMLGPQGQALLVARFGATDLGLQIPTEDMRSVGLKLVELGTVLAREPGTTQ